MSESSVWGYFYDEHYDVFVVLDYLICFTPQVFPFASSPTHLPFGVELTYTEEGKKMQMCMSAKLYENILLFT